MKNRPAQPGLREKRRRIKVTLLLKWNIDIRYPHFHRCFSLLASKIAFMKSYGETRFAYVKVFFVRKFARYRQWRTTAPLLPYKKGGGQFCARKPLLAIRLA